MDTQTSADQLLCAPCAQRFPDMDALYNHYEHSSKHFYCYTCDRHFETAKALSLHNGEDMNEEEEDSDCASIEYQREAFSSESDGESLSTEPTSDGSSIERRPISKNPILLKGPGYTPHPFLAGRKDAYFYVPLTTTPTIPTKPISSTKSTASTSSKPIKLTYTMSLGAKGQSSKSDFAAKFKKVFRSSN
jgi:hypothetical protein